MWPVRCELQQRARGSVVGLGEQRVRELGWKEDLRGETGEGMRAKDQRVQGEGGLKATMSGGPELEEEEKEKSRH